MGYELHITRRADWCDEGDDITRAEWRALAAADPDLRLSDEADPMLMADFQTADGPWPFVWFEGRIDVKSPPPAVIRKMHALALAFDARLQGDDGELYGLDGEMIPTDLNPADLNPAEPTPPPAGFFNRLFGPRR
ncbi:MAG: hypothetical protein AAFR46_01805 [Pseudomonadota bacterium]